MIATRLEDWTWRSQAVLAAELGRDGTIRRANLALERRAARALPGTPVAELVAEAQRPALLRRIRDAGDAWRPATFAFLADSPRPAEDRRVWLRGAEDAVLLVAEPAAEEQAQLVEKALELNDELVRANRRLLDARREAEANAERVRRLEAVASAGLASLDLEDVLQDILRVICEVVDADRALIVLLDRERGDLVVCATRGFDEDHIRVGLRVPPGAGVAGAIAADGRPRLVRDLRASDVRPLVPTHARSLAGVPLLHGGDVAGVLEVASPAPGAFGEAHLRLLLPAADRAAVAISRAQVLDRERRIAEVLQRALLPERLPEVPGHRLSVRFEPTSGEVGGDWYDALPLPSGEVALAIGDVAGKGVRAAALMGELRSGLRAYALDGGDPDAMLGRLDRLARRSEQMATVALVLLDPRTGALRHARAGHLPPLLVERDGAARFLRAGGSTPLLAYEPGAGSGDDVLPSGGRLILFTDGLVERRSEPIDESLDRLRAAAVAYDGPLDGLADHLLRTLRPPSGRLRDDIAVLAVERVIPS